MSRRRLNRLYCGRPVGIVTVTNAMNTYALDPRFDLRDHSPSGFSWGFGGSGPSQLALAILADALGDDARALRLYQHFKWRTVANFRRQWQMRHSLVVVIAADIEQQQEQRRRA